MNSTNLNPAQLARLQAQVGRHLRYLTRLRDRMTRIGFKGDDRLFLATCRARDAVQDVNTELHYLGCGKGTVGRS